MANNNKNPRRTIWLSETEPLSHYDIWLSKNQHLNSDGEPISDSGVLRDCDYIFKVWDCDNWHPIVGLNSTALNKINTVLNTSYETIHNGKTINSFSYKEFHLPLFTETTSSPSELFDAGTIGEAILEYVTDTEWLNIFEGGAFSSAFTYWFPLTINNGDIDINTLIHPAGQHYLGGIWANTFTRGELYPNNASISDDADDYNDWVAQAKYKPTHGTDNYNLYVSAKDIITIVNKYGEDNPDAPGIVPDINFLLGPAQPSNLGGIWATRFGPFTEQQHFVPIEAKFYPETYTDKYYRLCLSAEEIAKALGAYDWWQYNNGGQLLINGGTGIDVISKYDAFRDIHKTVVYIKHEDSDVGKILKLVQNPDLLTNEPVNDIEWVDYNLNGLDDVTLNNPLNDDVLYYDSSEQLWKNKQISSQDYLVLSSSSHDSGTKYVINGVGDNLPVLPENFILNGNGEWSKVSQGNGIINNITSSEIKISANIEQNPENIRWGGLDEVTVSKGQNTDYICILDNSDDSINVYEFQWLQINALYQITFDASLSLYKSGNPIYIYIDNPNTKVNFLPGVIFKNEDNLPSYDAILITIQFGIVKVEGCKNSPDVQL